MLQPYIESAVVFAIEVTSSKIFKLQICKKNPVYLPTNDLLRLISMLFVMVCGDANHY